MVSSKVAEMQEQDSGSDSEGSISEMLGLGEGNEDAEVEQDDLEVDSDEENAMAEAEINIDNADDDQLRAMFAAGALDKTVSIGGARKKPEKVDREPYLNVPGLEQRLADIKYPADMHWVQRMDVTSAEPLVIENIDDDAEREMAFYKQALEAANIARTRLTVYDVPVDRPEDYFAEMVKSDEHMKRVRMKLIEERENLEKSQNAKKQRELKKFGKEIEKQVLEKRNKQKKDDLESIKKLRKNRDNHIGDKDDDDQFNITVEKELSGGNKRKADTDRDSTGAFNKRAKPMHNPKRQAADAKYGYGGGKKHAKSNTRDSTDKSNFNPKQMKQPLKGMGTKKKGAAKRPGKGRRNKF
ncbi:hypothetical protein SARC_06780 [Sphaeroforma arctica JP610]|uniref:rRNA-processing protein EBP2 n=1 Tax=Sphaeroforma arctica JP610 TaxID=667725 RepID=A0A0L0FWD4_9EUKA|nr:hypothetical protein SARC_06780 [Sphaeroforma arctica JP610]KNC80881.1 hypothetical protein SARC_06780 [Sphaeroforma arctica JP610]|eukprot:XP_014154783.1 hypothetical protein SARC_06780 [Sphaeroforma arctica JP610]